MSTTLEILATTERRLQATVETCAELREQLEQAERERGAAREQFIKRDAAALALQACFNHMACEAERIQAELDAARHSRARLVQLWQVRGISARSWHAAERTWKP